nr:nitrate- and nitrite sensing domain-containing protein [Amycolatopsis suaedae]
MRNWRLRTKLLVVLLIPTVAVVALAGLRVRVDLAEADRLAEAASRVHVEVALSELTHQLQRERDLTVRHVAAGRPADVTELRDQRARVDTAVGRFGTELTAARPRLTAEAATAFGRVQDQLGGLTGLRFAGEHSEFPADAVLRSYGDLVAGLLAAGAQPVTETTEPELAGLQLATHALARIKEQMSVKRALLAEVLQVGNVSDERLRALLGAEAELAAARHDYRQFATPEQQRMYDDTVIGIVVDIGNDMVEAVVTRAEGDQPLAGLDPVRWDTAATYTVNQARKVEEALQVMAQNRTDALAEMARTAALRDAGVVFGVVLLAVVLGVLILRSLLRPLRTLRRSALEVAEHRLPAAVQGILADPEPPHPGTPAGSTVAPVPVFSREEFGEVARAFDAVHGEAVRLASEQARLRENINAMFVNLSRRSQDLVERQLSVLDRMEADEQDPDTLGGLFELDHLATRMRRNSENLLVLSGHDLGREVEGPVLADEVVGAALSEVEHYQRVELAPAPQLVVRAEAVSDLVHVISELLENATAYSPPDTLVSVYSEVNSDGDWSIEILDRGSGMPEPELARQNARLAAPPDVDVEVSRRMGLYVVARLAHRHGIRVRLAQSSGGGLEAIVVVPSRLVIVLPPEPEPEPEPAMPLSVLTSPPEPIVDPEPEPEPEPEPVWPVADEPIWPQSDPEPPRRAPVVGRVEQAPEWPTEADDPDAFDFDGPTDRMPAYEAVLAQWFRTAEERPTLTLSPEAVRGRMSRLQDGVERGRSARIKEGSER